MKTKDLFFATVGNAESRKGAKNAKVLSSDWAVLFL